MSITNIPLPTTIGTLQRFVRQSTDLENTGRRLQSATISKGGLHVYGDGKVIVEGGDVVVVDGDLKLGFSSLPPNALTNRLQVDLISSTASSRKNVKGNSGASWQEWSLFSIPVPEWAQTGIIVTYAGYVCVCTNKMYSNNIFINGGVKVSDQVSPPIPVNWGQIDPYLFQGQGAFSKAFTVTDKKDLPVSARFRCNDDISTFDVRPNVSSFVLWIREDK